MLIKSFFEFRGCDAITNKETGKTYYHFNLEDENGESCKFLSDFPGDDFEKSKKYNFVFDYSPRYSSIRVKDVIL